jgi:mRNA-degrading endonuclease RelE of RelBE toxin-antitoxin system
MLEFIEMTPFEKDRGQYFSDDSYRKFQDYLISDPRIGDVMEGTGGFRKVRWKDANKNQGKSGGIRIVYYFVDQDNQVFLAKIIGKSRVANLNDKQKKELKTIASFLDGR